ncbi:MAG: pentapeptide repeat-containing protein [Beijerinckiaceae bacterium]|nr:pentapeptide repeat-containing protein [Beijerinckiaceae bacterium]
MTSKPSGRPPPSSPTRLLGITPISPARLLRTSPISPARLLGRAPASPARLLGGGARFTGAAFGDGAFFDGARFKGHVSFSGKPIAELARDLRLFPDADPEIHEARVKQGERREASWEALGSGPDRFLTISFARARFDGPAIFTGRTFTREADLTQARFYSPPGFDAAAGGDKIDATHALVGFVPAGRWLHFTTDSAIPVRLRRLRKLAEETKNHDLERDLYIEERKAERGVYLVQRFIDWVKDPKKKWALIAHIFWILVMGAYWALSSYGRSVLRPLVLLVLSVPAFDRIYTAILAQLLEKAPDVTKYGQAVWMLALGNTVPFIGPLTIDPKIKQYLFCLGDEKCLPIPPEYYQFAVLSQNLLSIILVFFIGLALRNYFKIK